MGSPPSSCIAVRIAAKSTTAGTPVKSYRSTRAGLNGISTSSSEVCFQLRMVSMSAAKQDNKDILRLIYLTFDVEVVTITDCTLEKNSD